jgi:hypothetical protein
MKVKEQDIVITTREHADEALKAIQSLQFDVVLKEQLPDDEITAIRDRLLIDTAEQRNEFCVCAARPPNSK